MINQWIGGYKKTNKQNHMCCTWNRTLNSPKKTLTGTYQSVLGLLGVPKVSARRKPHDFFHHILSQAMAAMWSM